MHVYVNGSRCGFNISPVKCHARHGSRDVRLSRCIPSEPARSTVWTWATTKVEVKGENKMKVARKKDTEEDKENTRKM